MKRPLLIHIGYHKTGTTWLQKVLFQQAHGYRQILTHKEVFESIVKPSSFGFDPSAVKQKIEHERKKKTHTSVEVVSSEILSGNPFFGGRESDRFANRLFAIAPDALILITIREQMSIIKSVYMQYLSRGGTLSPSIFFDEAPSIGYYKFSADHFEYIYLIEKYIEIFGRDNVLVVTQEALAKYRQDSIRRIANFSSNTYKEDLDADAPRFIAPSYPEYVSPLLRRINHFRAGPLHEVPTIDLGALSHFIYRSAGGASRLAVLRRLFSGYRPVSSIVEERFRGKFRQGNRRLAGLLGDMVDLAGYEGLE